MRATRIGYGKVNVCSNRDNGQRDKPTHSPAYIHTPNIVNTQNIFLFIPAYNNNNNNRIVRVRCETFSMWIIRNDMQNYLNFKNHLMNTYDNGTVNGRYYGFCYTGQLKTKV